MKMPPRNIPPTATDRFIADAFHSTIYTSGFNFAIMDWSLYDRCVTRPGFWTPEMYRFYAIPAGGSTCGMCGAPASGLNSYCPVCGQKVEAVKTYADTNMKCAGKLYAPMAFSISKCLYFLLSAAMSPDDQRQLLEGYRWELRLGQKAFCMGPLARFPNVIRFDELELRPFTAPVDNPALAERNRIWLESQPPERRTAPDFRTPASHVLDLQVPAVIEHEWYFCMEVTGKPFQTDPNGTGVNFMSVMEGIAAMGVQ